MKTDRIGVRLVLFSKAERVETQVPLASLNSLDWLDLHE